MGATRFVIERAVLSRRSRSGSKKSLLDSSRSGFDLSERRSDGDETRSERNDRTSSKSKRPFALGRGTVVPLRARFVAVGAERPYLFQEQKALCRREEAL